MIYIRLCAIGHFWGDEWMILFAMNKWQMPLIVCLIRLLVLEYIFLIYIVVYHMNFCIISDVFFLHLFDTLLEYYSMSSTFNPLLLLLLFYLPQFHVLLLKNKILFYKLLWIYW